MVFTNEEKRRIRIPYPVIRIRVSGSLLVSKLYGSRKLAVSVVKPSFLIL
jgi:hypothetical protein